MGGREGVSDKLGGGGSVGVVGLRESQVDMFIYVPMHTCNIILHYESILLTLSDLLF
jgi:hypothetical protein